MAKISMKIEFVCILSNGDPCSYRAGLYILSHDAEATNGLIAQPYKCLCVCVMCSSREPCTVFGIAPSLILASFLCAKSRAARAPVGRTATARPSSEPAAGQPPSTQPTAHSPRGLEHQYQLAAQTAIKWLSKFNRCHLSHIREDTCQPSVPVQEF